MQSNNMIRIEAAGAGKTYGICSEALNLVKTNNHHSKVLIISYTNRGIDSIKSEIRKQNCGVLCKDIDVMTWYRFLLHEMIKPYQSYIFKINEIRSLDFSETYGIINYGEKGTRERYINGSGDIRSNVAGELACYINMQNGGKNINRIASIYSNLYIDEVQDMAGYDLEIIELLMKSHIAVTCVGDGKQATFKTNNSIKNKKTSGANIWAFFQDMIDENTIEVKKNLVSRRFNQEICDFANEVYPNENNIRTSMNEYTNHDGVFLIKQDDVEVYYDFFQPTVLKYDRRTKTDAYYSINFGECKGMTFERVLIYPNGAFKDFLLKGKKFSSPQKYYVAATRAKYSIAFVVDKFPKETEWLKMEKINVGDYIMEVMRYISSKL